MSEHILEEHFTMGELLLSDGSAHLPVKGVAYDSAHHLLTVLPKTTVVRTDCHVQTISET